ncbi:hypothetical protein ACFWAY_32865 [Rhodococcus sp. NPDC059968]|uniref:hypothetical protein n=1 Tax=Rhodococcus sp. NPDC059968 TaxID=3347017 RepID=UPI00366DBD6F
MPVDDDPAAADHERVQELPLLGEKFLIDVPPEIDAGDVRGAHGRQVVDVDLTEPVDHRPVAGSHHSFENGHTTILP